ncbi:hypothetical protein I8U19_00325 [Thermoactinomyces sp. CICC 10523]|nr:hypothetical protein [Thermoactinomyces sp. CICC 10523]
MYWCWCIIPVVYYIAVPFVYPYPETDPPNPRPPRPTRPPTPPRPIRPIRPVRPPTPLTPGPGRPVRMPPERRRPRRGFYG